jgi:hypothetical protein
MLSNITGLVNKTYLLSEIVVLVRTDMLGGIKKLNKTFNPFRHNKIRALIMLPDYFTFAGTVVLKKVFSKQQLKHRH